MPYIDAHVLPIPRDKLDAYKAFSESMLHFWMENGCTSYVECIEDDVPRGELTSFPLAVKAKDDELVAFGWAVWPDKATRDAANEKMMSAPQPSQPLPFDGKRMFWGGFRPLIERGKGA